MGGMQGLSGFDGTKLSQLFYEVYYSGPSTSTCLERARRVDRRDPGPRQSGGRREELRDVLPQIRCESAKTAEAPLGHQEGVGCAGRGGRGAESRRENEDFDVVDGGFGAYHPLDLESAYAKLGERATWQVRSRPLTQQFTEGGPLNPRDFRRRVRSEFDVDLTERELSAVVASLNEGGADADAELVDGQRFLKRMNMLNSTARRLPRVEKTPVAGDWIRNERYNARPITADRYTNQDFFTEAPVREVHGVRPVRRGSANSDAGHGPQATPLPVKNGVCAVNCA